MEETLHLKTLVFLRFFLKSRVFSITFNRFGFFVSPWTNHIHGVISYQKRSLWIATTRSSFCWKPGSRGLSDSTRGNPTRWFKCLHCSCFTVYQPRCCWQFVYLFIQVNKAVSFAGGHWSSSRGDKKWVQTINLFYSLQHKK